MNVRPFGEEDFAAIALLLEDDELAHGRSMQIGVNELSEWTSRTDLERDSWLYEDHAGPVAVGWVAVYGDVGSAVGVVHPRAKRRGLGTELVERSERALRPRGVARIHQFAIADDGAAAELLAKRGYHDARHFFDMAIRLEARPDVPAGVAVETFREEDARAFHAALEESFEDHWEHHATPFEEWWDRQRSSPGFDPALWLLVRDGDEIVAASRNEANRNGGGYVGALGVRRPWRGRGYAKALLLHGFRVFYDRGLSRVTLGVDAESPTGATHLYERVGMRVEQENVIFEKSLES